MSQKTQAVPDKELDPRAMTRTGGEMSDKRLGLGALLFARARFEPTLTQAAG